MKLKLGFHPELFATLKTYSKDKFIADLMAGVIVGIVALPLAIAFGIASGVSPEKGLITAIIGGFIVSFLGGTKVQIGGPTGAFIVIVYGIVANPQFGIGGLAVATIMAGIMLMLMGFLKLGGIIKFIPYPIIVGFTSGIAVTIFTTQVNDLLGLNLTNLPGDFFSKWVVYFLNLSSITPVAVFLSLLSVILILITPKFSKKIPGSLIAIIIVTIISVALTKYFGITGITTIGDSFPDLSADIKLQGFDLPNLDQIQLLIPLALTIAILGAIESLLSATVADGITGDKHNSNTELVAQGAANVVVPFFGGIPVTGAIARTMTNVNNGAKSPIAGIIHAVMLLLIMLFLLPLAKHIPLACLAGVLAVISYNMSEWRTFLSLIKNSRSDASVLIITFLLTVIFNLTVAIEVGLLFAVLLFMKRVSENTKISVATGGLDLSDEGEFHHEEAKLELRDGIEVYEIDGPFFFGVANKIDELMNIVAEHKAKVRIIRMRKVPFMDTTGLHNLESLYRLSHDHGIHVVLSGVNRDVRKVLRNSPLYNQIGKKNVCANISVALKVANEYLDSLPEQED
ncbi:sulfate permease [Campylobacter iguaniorum]|uniref:SulP family inorganic anion transporter n=1 Tax=Campylobacter iguaniorum TaxID=1244531 RepID=UPI00073A12C4|nr:SulP family inorganic anion transporter [Campylobacter iguaniorum]ALV25418.1 sulfate permease [Campylobacter iguaniorum]